MGYWGEGDGLGLLRSDRLPNRGLFLVCFTIVARLKSSLTSSFSDSDSEPFPDLSLSVSPDSLSEELSELELSLVITGEAAVAMVAFAAFGGELTGAFTDGAGGWWDLDNSSGLKLNPRPESTWYTGLCL